MKATPTALPEVLVLQPKVFGDDRGFFFESFNERAFNEAVGRPVSFVQDNHSRSVRGVLRGLHYQIDHTQGKLVRVVQRLGLRRGRRPASQLPDFGKWVGVELDAASHQQLWVPEGFGHGFIVTSDTADFLYKTTDYWEPRSERCIAWNDATLDIHWPLAGGPPTVSAKDAQGKSFVDAEVFA